MDRLGMGSSAAARAARSTRVPTRRLRTPGWSLGQRVPFMISMRS